MRRDVTQASGGRRILVSADCQTGALASAFRAIFPDDEVRAVPQPNVVQGRGIEEFAGNLRSCDIWIRYHDKGGMLNRADIAEAAHEIAAIDIPSIVFRAFHPDLFYVVREAGKQAKQDYNSGIIAWCFQHGIDRTDVYRLFHTDIYAALGYFDVWPESVASLERSFAHCGLDFRRFFRNVKRNGAFMHTVNHPKIGTTVAFAKTIAMKLGATPNLWGRRLDITDHFSDFSQWPVYPEIAHYFAIPGSYVWVDRGAYRSLHQYIDQSWLNYEAEGSKPEVMRLHASERVRQHFDRVLTAYVRNRA